MSFYLVVVVLLLFILMIFITGLDAQLVSRILSSFWQHFGFFWGANTEPHIHNSFNE